MGGESKASRMSRLADEIGYALGRGEYPTDTINQFSFLWSMLDEAEQDGLRTKYGRVNEALRTARMEQARVAGHGKMRRTPVTTGRIDGDT